MPSLATTRPFGALGHTFAVTAPAAVAAHVEAVFHALAVRGPAQHRYAMTPTLPADGPGGTWRLVFDGHDIGDPGPLGEVHARLCWHVNRTAIDGCHGRLLLHSAGAVGPSGSAVVLPASEDSGKTTVVAGLVRSGLAYLSDEAVGIDLASGRALGYPKPLSVDPGSWTALSDLRPAVGDYLAPILDWQWQVPPAAVGPVAEGGTPVLVVSPRYVAGAETEVVPLSRAETLVLLAENAFNLHDFGPEGFEVLATIAASCPGYRLVHGDLEGAVRAVRSLLEAEAP